MPEGLHLAPFDRKHPLKLISAPSGGWVVTQEFFAGEHDKIVGAFSNSHDLLVALTKALTPSGDDKEAAND